MKKISISILSSVIIITFFMLAVSCEKEDGNETNISSYDATESHNTGEVCMQCHISGGDGEGWFTAAGSIYNLQSTIFPNATVRFYTGQDGTGTLVKTIEADANGNFYTTEDINFGSGLYVVIEGTSGVFTKMNSILTTGNCNNCHGNSVDNIWVE